MRGTLPRTPSGVSNLAVSLDSQNLSPVDGSDLVIFLDLFPKVGKTTRPVIRLHAQVISTVVESVFPVSLPPPAEPCRAGPGRAWPGRAGPLSAAGRASERDQRQGFGAHDRAGLRHATGGRASERYQASAHTTGPGFGTPLPQLIPRRRDGLCRFRRFVSKRWQDDADGQLVSSRES